MIFFLWTQSVRLKNWYTFYSISVKLLTSCDDEIVKQKNSPALVDMLTQVSVKSQL